MEALLLVQNEIIDNLKNAEKNYKKAPKDRIKRAYLETRLEVLEKLYEEFKEGHKKITIASKDRKEKYFSDNIHEYFEELYINYKSNLREALEQFSISESCLITDKRDKNVCSEMKLPRIQLPTFGGRYEQWQTFYDMFSSLIHNNKSITSVQKLHYLKSNLSGDALDLLRNYSTTDANYEEAWNHLVRRYNNKRYNCNEVMRALFAMKKINIESAATIKHLLDTTTICLKSLENMGISTETWDVIIIHLVVSKLDTESIKQWEQRLSVTSGELPTWSQLRDYLEYRYRSLEMIDASTARAVQTTKPPMKPRSFHAAFESRSKIKSIKCAMCQEDHYIYGCKQFGTMSPKERQDFVQNNNLCFNCLAPSHAVIKCRHKVSCKKCGRRHHTLLHFDKLPTLINEPTASSNLQPCTKEEVNVVTTFSKDSSQTNAVLLATANVKVMLKNNLYYVVRTLIDQGSQASFITESTVQMLGLVRKPVSGWVSGLGDGRTKIKYMVSLSIQSCYDANKFIQITAFVLKSLTSLLPAADLDSFDGKDIVNLPLADSTFTNSGKIDVLLGADVYSEILLDGVMKHPTRKMVAQNTIFGWIVSGRVSRKLPTSDSVISMHVSITSEYDIIKQFWELENEPQGLYRELTTNEKKCEEFFERTTVRDEEGRYVVRLPFSTDDPQCFFNNSKDIALKRFLLLEKRLIKNVELRKEYNNVMEEYLSLNHLIEVPESDINNTKSVYLPHHAVLRDDKTTTKVRVVFDASCKGENNISLNDELLVGPKLQQDLRHLLMRWRVHKVVVIADIVKMFRMIKVSEGDTDFQRIIWRFDINEQIKHYKLLRLTFGTASAPYLAVKCLQNLADSEENRYPEAARVAKLDYFMDDLMTGFESKDKAIVVCKEMKCLMKSAGFILQKWSSNDKEILNELGVKDEEKDQTTEVKINDIMKVLGVGWNKRRDTFVYTVNLPKQEEYTKRQVVSDIARLYDPLGWIAPVIVMAKVFIQKLWKSNLEWDEILSEPYMNEWLSYRSRLTHLKDLQIPRWVNTAKLCSIQLHAFSDASKTAFAATVYIRVTDERDNVFVHLLTAKTKVAPLKEITIPRLELCGAVLAAKLLFEVSQILNVPKQNLYGWSDSTIVLAWLKGGSSRWATFVSNRVSTILNILDYEHWGHVTSETNPADHASRGLTPKELITNELWWSGPTWLKEKDCISDILIEDTREEEKIKVLSVIANTENEFMWAKYSNLRLTLRVISYCKRWLNYKTPKTKFTDYPKFITASEMKDALLLCIKQTQEYYFGEEIEQLKIRGVVPRKGHLSTLYPIFDEYGILRVGGRITHSDIAYDTRHPIIIPAKSHFSRLIILDAHLKTLHGGPQAMLNLLKMKYWIIRARLEVKKIFRECITCRKYSTKSNSQLMGQIPEVRLKPSKPFNSTGVDYAGPINIRFSPGRYIYLFICMVTRAIHLEAVTDLSAKGFLAAFRRFVARRGRCQNLYSDNGTNFVGAQKSLKEMLEKYHLSLPASIAESLASEGTTWHFMPPYSPNFGGLWEAGVRSTKTHLFKIIGNHTLTYEELSTVLSQIEGCLNSRPISVLSDNPIDPLPLTPGHFLVGEPLVNIADDDYSTINVTGLDRWKLVQKMVRDFWNKWSKEYLVTLNQRYKWQSKNREPNINDVVVLKEDHVPPARWILGKIADKHPGSDNITRVVSIKCKNGVFKRPLNKICVLCN